MTGSEPGGGAGLTRVAAAAARDLFIGLLPDIVERADEFRVDTDVIDAEILDLFTEKMRVTAITLAAACARHDEQAIRDKGHSLEGMGGTMGFAEISVVGRELSRAARAQEWDRCAALAERLSRWTDTLIPSEPPHA